MNYVAYIYLIVCLIAIPTVIVLICLQVKRQNELHKKQMGHFDELNKLADERTRAFLKKLKGEKDEKDA